jgi:hypothetical protein
MKPLPPVLRRAAASARAERPSAEARARTLSALGVVPRGKLGLGPKIGGAIGVAALVAYLALPKAPNGGSPAVEAVPAAPEPSSQLGTSEPAPLAPVVPVVPVASIASASAAKPAPRAPSRPSAPVEVDAAPAEPSLSDEVAALDAASRTLREGRCRATLDAIRDYRARFPKQRLSAEFELLEIDAIGRGGDRSRAQRLASDYLASHPTTPYRARLAAWNDDTPVTSVCTDGDPSVRTK